MKVAHPSMTGCGTDAVAVIPLRSWAEERACAADKQVLCYRSGRESVEDGRRVSAALSADRDEGHETGLRPGAKLKVLPTGHYAGLQTPELMVEAIEGFLEDAGA